MAGVNVVWAANHWMLAVATHAANHPNVVHACQDLQQADWAQVPSHDLLMASPCCQGHADARGRDRPGHDASRSTAWAVISAAEYHQPPVVLVENVPEFREWALYPAWRMALGALGYAVAEHVVDAADFGVPQHRERMFLVCTRSKAPIALDVGTVPHAPIRPIIAWDDYRWSAVDKPQRAKATLARVARGRAAFGERFVMPYYGRGSGLTGRSLDRPLGTVTTRDRWAVVDGDRMRMLQPREYLQAMGFRADYRIPKQRTQAIHLLGNAVCPPVACGLIQAIRRAL